MTNNPIEIQPSYYEEGDCMLTLKVKDEVTNNYIITPWRSEVI